jgi:hypothetical protein
MLCICQLQDLWSKNPYQYPPFCTSKTIDDLLQAILRTGLLRLTTVRQIAFHIHRLKEC